MSNALPSRLSSLLLEVEVRLFRLYLRKCTFMELLSARLSKELLPTE